MKKSPRIVMEKSWNSVFPFTYEPRGHYLCQNATFNLIKISCEKIESNIHAPLLLNLLNSLRKSNIKVGK